MKLTYYFIKLESCGKSRSLKEIISESLKDQSFYRLSQILIDALHVLVYKDGQKEGKVTKEKNISLNYKKQGD